VGSYTFTASYTPDSSSSATYNSATGTSPTVIVAVPVTATPVFSVPAGSYSSTQTVTISDATAGATIYYTTNATTPTTSSTVYSGGAITVSSSETLEAIATASGYTTSAVANAGYYITPLAVGGALDWTWMGGSSTALCSGSAGAGGFCGQSGTYGTLGAPAAANRPGGRDSAVSWTDSSGNFWVFGGEGLDSVGTWGILNDLWEFKPSIGQWAWMGGRSTVPGYYQASPGVYGTLGNPAAGNIPMGRENSNAWTDQSGNFWLFGGLIIDASNDFDDLNDLWEFNPSTGQWAWMGGSQTIGSTCYQYPSDYNFCGRAGVYGTLGIGSTSNIPGSRDSSVTWTDKKGNLWLFGGEGEDSAGNFGDLNDLWEFNPSTNQWTWMGGSSTVYQSGVYGTLGTPAAGNIPGSRYGAVSWTDSNGNFWLFGGYGFDSGGNYGSLNDLWEFNPTTNEWTWMGGSSTIAGATGIYGSIGVAAPGNVPSGRQYAAGWTDGNGNFRMLGGVSDSFLNDLWEFNPSSKEWTWIGGSSTVGANGGQPGVYGSLGVAAAGNAPGGRYSSIDWTDRTGNLWLFGGGGFDSGGGYGELNDLWEYQLPTTTPTVTVTPSSTSITTMQGLTVTVAVSAGSDNLTPTGSVILTGTGGFSTNSTALSSGSATINIPAGLLALGSDTFTATYTPDSSSSIIYNSATGTSSAVTVSPVTPTITWPTPAAITYGTALSTTQLNASSTVAGTFVYTPASGTLTAGSQTLSVTLTPTDTTDYTTATATVTLTVNKATPAITWPTPAAITYGTALSTTQLNASSTVAGTFAYTPAVGTVLTAGSHTLSVTLTPTDTTDYTTATSTVTQTVNQATPTITWATPAAITYGTALSATQLDATSTVAGTFAYTPAVGSVPNTGAQTLSVTLTPTDTTDYTTATATVQLTVSKAAPAITWPTPAAITYGSALSATQLNASSTVAGTFAYTPASGTVLTAGSHTLSVTLTPTDTTDYTTATSTVTQTVNQATPTITWATPAAITYGTALSATQLDATASVPGTFVYSPAAGTTPAVGSDTLSVTFTPTDATDYTTATASVTLVVTSPLNPVPVVSSISPAFTDAGGAVFTLTVNGSGFIASSTIYWGASALTTTCVSATQLTAQVPAADIATAAGTIAITVQTPAPGGGSSNAWQFEVDSVSSVSTAPTITSTTETVTAGSPASYPVTVPSAVTSVSVTCLNLPTGAACSYSSTTNTVTITTSSTTPKGTYQIVVVFTETVSGAASGFILLPILLLPLGFMRRKLAARGIWLTACLGLVLMATAALSIGCGGGGGSGSTPPPATHQVTSSGAVSLTIQ
jgi:N-acetylneuraminic acid mutarotase